jgi:hypothetical protein
MVPDTEIRRVVVKGLTARSKPYARIKASTLYQEAWSADQKALIVDLHASKLPFTEAEVRAYLNRAPLPTIAEVEKQQAATTATKKTKLKRNVTGKGKQKRKSGIVKGWPATGKLRIAFKSSVGGRGERKVRPEHARRGKRLIGLGEQALANLLASPQPNAMQQVMAHIGHMQANNLTQSARQIGGVHVSTDTSRMNAQPTDVQGYLAMTHAKLTGTNNRSDYGAFVRPDATQSTGIVHPLEDPATNASFAVLNAIEAVRNNGQFIVSMLLKREAMGAGYITARQAVNPTKFGTQEIKEVSGQQRGDFTKIVRANTDYALDFIIDSGGAPLANVLDELMDEQDDGNDTTDLELEVVEAIEDGLLELTDT